MYTYLIFSGADPVPVIVGVIFAALIAILAMTSTVFLRSGSTDSDRGLLQKVNTSTTAPLTTPMKAAPATTAPANTTPTAAPAKAK